jgi:hypothetical protein
MARMMVHHSGSCGCCPAPERGTARQREKREIDRWRDEYESDHQLESDLCWNDNLDCPCSPDACCSAR